MSGAEINPEQLAQTLERSENYRVLRLRPRQAFRPSETEPAKRAILLEVETTGLDTTRDEVVELGMVKFSYLADGKVSPMQWWPATKSMARPSMRLSRMRLS
jgi:DNA polymerase III epsilon subunit-like protein